MRIGGNVLDSGSYGCVFYPSLKCNNTKSSKKNVSKLMTYEDAIEEYNNIQKIKYILNKKFTNYGDYMILSNEICNAPNLSQNDLKNYHRCILFKKKNIEKKDVNKKIKDFIILNQRYGGIELGIFFQKQNEKNIGVIILQLIKLLTHCILRINKLNIYHLDLKSNNILVQKGQPHIIDWGLSEIYPTMLTFRGHNKFQFNLPFGNVVFGENFNNICRFKVPPEEARRSVKLFMASYKYSLETIETIMKLLNKNHLECLEEYLVNIIINYTKEEYFEIFLHNVDIWGFVNIFVDILESFKHYRQILFWLFNYIYSNPGYLDIKIIIDNIRLLSDNMKKNTVKNTRRRRSSITNTSKNFR
jgi:serine/threonine protein kinase